MRTHFSKTRSVKRTQHLFTPDLCAPVCANGMIRELIYSDRHPDMTQLLLLPLLLQLGAQSRWQLWLTPQQKLSRDWLLRSGLPLNKVMQSPYSGAITTVEAMIKALQTGNYSVVLGWFEKDLAASDRQRLQRAAESGQALGLVMRSACDFLPSATPYNGLKIHSSLYH